MICPYCNHLFLPKLANNQSLSFVRTAPLTGCPEYHPDFDKVVGIRLRQAAVLCPRCGDFIDGANRNTIAYEDCHKPGPKP